MAGYVTLPDAWRDRSGEAEPWVRRALDHVGSLPPKVKKPKR
jgi:hypothetical protein